MNAITESFSLTATSHKKQKLLQQKKLSSMKTTFSFVLELLIEVDETVRMILKKMKTNWIIIACHLQRLLMCLAWLVKYLKVLDQQLCQERIKVQYQQFWRKIKWSWFTLLCFQQGNLVKTGIETSTKVLWNT